MKLSQTAVAFWIAAGAVGWLIGGGIKSAVLGAVIAYGVSFIANIINEVRNS